MDKTVPPKISGVRYIPNTTPEYLKAFSELPTRSDDVIVCTWPKSGTTWCQNILWKIYHGVHEDTRPIEERVPFIDMVVIPKTFLFSPNPEDVSKNFGKMSSPRLLKTHLSYKLAPKGSEETIIPRYIYVMRNPKDAAVSLYHHYLNSKSSSYSKPWDHFFNLFMNNEVVYGSWFDHVLGWWEHKDDPRILFLKYEDMKKDLPGTIERISRFVKKDLSSNEVERIANQTTFKYMKEDDSVGYSRFFHPGTFIRKGEVGDWRNYFTPEQNRLFDEMYAERMKGTGLEFDFGERFWARL